MTEQALPWEQPGWLNEARAWIEVTLKDRGVRLVGEIEQPYIRPWSTVLNVPTDDGCCYFKATAPALAHEPALTELLSRLHPDVSPDLLAVDLRRGWMLMRDSGTPLRVYIKSEKSLARWRDIMPLYAGLQKVFRGSESKPACYSWSTPLALPHVIYPRYSTIWEATT